MIHFFNMAHWSSMKIGQPTINLMGNMMINLIKHEILAVYSCFGQDKIYVGRWSLHTIQKDAKKRQIALKILNPLVNIHYKLYNHHVPYENGHVSTVLLPNLQTRPLNQLPQTLVEFQSDPNRFLRPDRIKILQIISNLSNAIINNPSKLMEFILVYTTHLWQI